MFKYLVSINKKGTSIAHLYIETFVDEIVPEYNREIMAVHQVFDSLDRTIYNGNSHWGEAILLDNVK